MSSRPRLIAAAILSIPALATAACSGDSSAADAVQVSVTSTDDTCEITPGEATAGPVNFSVQNDGSTETEFYLYKQDGTSVVAEVEHIGPGLMRDMSADLDPGTYVTACKPGMEGDGIRAEFIVTDA